MKPSNFFAKIPPEKWTDELKESAKQYDEETLKHACAAETELTLEKLLAIADAQAKADDKKLRR